MMGHLMAAGITMATGQRRYIKGLRADGSPWEKVMKWFGYRLHLIVDANMNYQSVTV